MHSPDRRKGYSEGREPLDRVFRLSLIPSPPCSRTCRAVCATRAYVARVCTTALVHFGHTPRCSTSPSQGLESPDGYYQVVQPVGQVTYTFWFQFCSNMQLVLSDPNRPGVRTARPGGQGLSVADSTPSSAAPRRRRARARVSKITVPRSAETRGHAHAATGAVQSWCGRSDLAHHNNNWLTRTPHDDPPIM